MQNEIIFICSTFTHKVTAQRKFRISASGKSGQHTIFINMSRVFISYALRYGYGYSMTEYIKLYPPYESQWCNDGQISNQISFDKSQIISPPNRNHETKSQITNLNFSNQIKSFSSKSQIKSKSFLVKFTTYFAPINYWLITSYT